MPEKSPDKNRWAYLRTGALLAAVGAGVFGFYAAGLQDRYFLLFHTLAELFSLIVVCGVFVVAWHSRRLLDNHYLLLVGIVYLGVAALGALHMLAYKGLGVLGTGDDANLPTQLWLAVRSLTAGAYLAALLFLRRPLNAPAALAVTGALTAALAVAIFTGVFPDCFVPGEGLTPFKVAGECVIAGLFLAALVLLFVNNRRFDKAVFQRVAGSLVLSIAAELAFTLYAEPYGPANMVGHLFVFFSFYLVYRAIIETGLAQPLALLFHNLKASEEALRAARDQLEVRVEERTAELARTVRALEAEAAARARAQDQLRKVNRALMTISECNQAVGRATDEQVLLHDICRIIIGFEAYRVAWVGYAEDGPGRRVRPAAQAGASDALLQSLHVTWADAEEGRGPVGTAIRTGRPQHVDDVMSDPALTRWRPALVRAGCGSAIALPLSAGGRTFGALSIWAVEKSSFDDEQVGLLKEMADNLAFGITVLRARAERERARAQLEAERRRLFETLNLLPGYVCLVGSDYRVRFANHPFISAFGDPGDRSCHEVLHGLHTPCEYCYAAEILASGKPQDWEWTSMAGRTYEVRAYPFVDTDGTRLVLELGIDVTDRQRLEHDVLEISEEERRRIGQDLHDALGGTLMGVAFMTTSLAQRLASEAPDAAPLAAEIARLIKSAQREARTLAHGLVPVEMRAEGLMTALRQLAAATEERFQVTCRFECPQPVLVDDATVAMHLYRIAQEAVTNAVRHGKAGEIDLLLTHRDGELVVAIEDDGAGLPQDLDLTRGRGVRIMNYRARMMRGTLAVLPGLSRGVRVVCSVPRAVEEGQVA